MSRSRRLALIAELVSDRVFESQEELAEALARKGVEVTQATLSRDLRSLGVLKRPGDSGRTRYEMPGPAHEAIDRERRLLELKAFVNDVRAVQNLVLVRTPPGHANGVGRAIDLARYDGVEGTIAGDDTVLVVMADATHARRLKKSLDALAAGVGAGK